MSKVLCSIIIFLSLVIICCGNKHDLRDTKWRVTRFSVDTPNYLKEQDKYVYKNFDPSTKLFSNYTDSLIFTYVEGSVVDTSTYYINSDTLFYIQDFKRDTVIILKLTKDSLIERRLAGATTYSVRIK
jgi:hypothetical protein